MGCEVVCHFEKVSLLNYNNITISGLDHRFRKLYVYKKVEENAWSILSA